MWRGEAQGLFERRMMPAASNSFLAHCSFSGSNLRALAKTGRPDVSMLRCHAVGGVHGPLLTTSGYFWRSFCTAGGREVGTDGVAGQLAGRWVSWLRAGGAGPAVGATGDFCWLSEREVGISGLAAGSGSTSTFVPPPGLHVGRPRAATCTVAEKFSDRTSFSCTNFFKKSMPSIGCEIAAKTNV